MEWPNKDVSSCCFLREETTLVNIALNRHGNAHAPITSSHLGSSGCCKLHQIATILPGPCHCPALTSAMISFQVPCIVMRCLLRPQCFLMFLDVSWCFLMFLDVFDVFDVSWCFLMFLDVSWCFLMFLDVLDGSWCFLVFLEVSWISPHNATWHGIAWQHYATTCSNKLLVWANTLGKTLLQDLHRTHVWGPGGSHLHRTGKTLPVTTCHNVEAYVRPNRNTHTHTRAQWCMRQGTSKYF